MAADQHAGLSGLGKRVEFPTHYDPSLLEAFPNAYPEVDYEVVLECFEFTHICPATGQPDFGKIYITYTPSMKLVESKSLKLYLGSYRQHGTFHESVICQICKDLADLMRPIKMVVRGEFNSRGGIAINPVARYDLFTSPEHLNEMGREKEGGH